jgi:endonuclease-3
MKNLTIKQKTDSIFEILKKLNPNPTTELNYSNTFQLLIAVLLSAQSTDVGVNKATKSLFKKIKTPQQMLDFGLENLRDSIKTIGLFNTKARNTIKTATILVEKHNSEVPKTRKELEELPGVGRKTANVVLNTAFGENFIAVDTHIFRLGNRLGIAKGKDVLTVEKKLMKNISKQYLKNAHHWLILHGRYICVAKKPKCEICPIYLHCNSFQY